MRPSPTTDISPEAIRYTAMAHIGPVLGERLWAGEPIYNVDAGVWEVSIHSYDFPDQVSLGRIELNLNGDIARASTPRDIERACRLYKKATASVTPPPTGHPLSARRRLRDLFTPRRIAWMEAAACVGMMLLCMFWYRRATNHLREADDARQWAQVKRISQEKALALRQVAQMSDRIDKLEVAWAAATQDQNKNRVTIDRLNQQVAKQASYLLDLHFSFVLQEAEHRRLAVISPDQGDQGATMGDGAENKPQIRLRYPVGEYIATIRPVLQWDPVQGASVYDFWLREVRQGRLVDIVTKTAIKTPRYQEPITLCPGKEYEWQVMAHFVDGRPSVNSRYVRFKVLDSEPQESLRRRLRQLSAIGSPYFVAPEERPLFRALIYWQMGMVTPARSELERVPRTSSKKVKAMQQKALKLLAGKAS